MASSAAAAASRNTTAPASRARSGASSPATLLSMEPMPCGASPPAAATAAAAGSASRTHHCRHAVTGPCFFPCSWGCPSDWPALAAALLACGGAARRQGGRRRRCWQRSQSTAPGRCWLPAAAFRLPLSLCCCLRRGAALLLRPDSAGSNGPLMVTLWRCQRFARADACPPVLPAGRPTPRPAVVAGRKAARFCGVVPAAALSSVGKRPTTSATMHKQPGHRLGGAAM
jgi:hypothetical protein